MANIGETAGITVHLVVTSGDGLELPDIAEFEDMLGVTLLNRNLDADSNGVGDTRIIRIEVMGKWKGEEAGGPLHY